MKTISAIIVNWNNKEAAAACVRSLQAQTGVDVEIIVCDNASTDGSVAHLRGLFPDIRIIQNSENLGFGPALNKGLAVAGGEHLIFLNNDLVLEPDCLRHLSAMLDSSSSLGGVVPNILYTNKTGVLNSFGVDVHYTGIAWYRIDVDVPDDWAGLDARAVFDGVDDSFTVWLDGARLGQFGDPATGTTVWLEQQVQPLGQRLTPGRHTLVLRVVDHAGAGGLWKPARLTTGPTGAAADLLR